MQKRTRNEQLLVRVTPDEKAMIRQKMEISGIDNFSAYARKMLLEGRVIRLDLSEFQSLAKEVNKVGVNINQIAKAVNASGSVFGGDVSRLKEMVNEIWRLLKSCLSGLLSRSR